MLPSIVIIEDDRELQMYLSKVLSENNFSVRTVSNGVGGLKMVEKVNPDLVILDLLLPDMDGKSVCMEIRKYDSTLPIIMLTAKDGVSDKIKGLSSGADDYVTKPFMIDELVARIKTRIRNSHNSKTVIKIADLELDSKKIEVRRAGKIIPLTAQEFKLLEYLMLNQGVVLSRDMILNRIWFSSPDVETRVVDVYIGYLRKKIDVGNKKKLLHSVRGFGYTLKG